MKFTLLGGRGFIGRHLASHLRAAGHEVVVPDRRAQPDSGACMGHVIYAIGLTGDFREKPFATVEAHVETLARCLDSARFLSWIYLSSTRVYGTSATDTREDSRLSVLPGADGLYDLSKLLGESLCLALPRPEIKVARLSNVYGHDQNATTFLGNLLSSARKRQDIRINEHPDSEKDYLSVDDAVACIEHISLAGAARIYNVASGRNISHRALADRIGQASGMSVSFEGPAPLRRFPPIDTALLQTEFPFTPRDLLNDLPSLVHASSTSDESQHS